MHAISQGLTDVGRKRPHNEDSYFHNDKLGLYVVADGMGGHAAGEVASAEAVDQIHGVVRRGFSSVETLNKDDSRTQRAIVRRLLESSVQAATYMVFGMAQVEPDRKGMGTTISSLLVTDKLAYIAQVGDSRVYMIRDGWAVQVTEDHTWVNYQVKIGNMTPAQAKASPRANAITRAVGIKDYVDVDTFEVAIRPGDRFVLCSDGLHGYFENTNEIASTGSIPDMQQACKAFIDLANERGGKDNITVIVLEIQGQSAAPSDLA